MMIQPYRGSWSRYIGKLVRGKEAAHAEHEPAGLMRELPTTKVPSTTTRLHDCQRILHHPADMHMTHLQTQRNDAIDDADPNT